ncbi:MAG: DinB family protein [Dehalococcoidia bacterium]
MTELRAPTKSEIVEALRTSAAEVAAQLRARPSEAFERGCYENGWNGRQILAHIASIEWTYPRLLEIAQEGDPAETAPAQPVRRTSTEEAAGVPTRTARGGIDAYNERQVEKRANATVTELLAEFERNRAVLIAAVEGTDETLFAAPIRSAGGVTGSLGSVLQAVAVNHILGHARDIAGEAGRS